MGLYVTDDLPNSRREYEMHDTSTSDDNFDVACSFLGWGDPGRGDQRGIWFVGLEEGGRGFRWTQSLVESRRGNTFIDWRAEGEDVGNVDTWASKIVSKVSSRCVDGDWRRYRDQILGREGSGVCLTNLYPLGKRSRAEWPEEYEQLFGFPRQEYETYRRRTTEKRFPKLLARWRECHPQATICFGESGWNDFRNLFVLDERSTVDRVCTYADRRILLIPFLGPAGRKGPMNERIVK